MAISVFGLHYLSKFHLWDARHKWVNAVKDKIKQLLFSFNSVNLIWVGNDLWCFSFFIRVAHQDYFSHFELSKSLGGAKIGDPQEKPPDCQQAEFGLSHMWPVLGSNIQQWDEKRFRALKISGLNHSATGAAWWLSTQLISSTFPVLDPHHFLVTCYSWQRNEPAHEIMVLITSEQPHQSLCYSQHEVWK